MKIAKSTFYIKVNQEDLICEDCNVPAKYEDMIYEKLPWWEIWKPPRLENYLYKCPICGKTYLVKEYYPKFKDEIVKND